ncbi:MAG: DUF1972 domain-containing protein [Victivallaceae bacterium]|nr:DUF1972 domain-containing protein [Victivallaceae bacterium]
MNKVAIIGTRGIPAGYGGFETLAEQLVRYQRDDLEFTVYCQKSAFEQRPRKIGRANLKYIPLGANGISSIFYDMWSMLDAIRYADTLLILGVSGCPLLPFLRFFRCRKRFVCNIDGLEWRRVKWSRLASLYLRFAERCAVRNADVVIADNQVIVDYVAQRYGNGCELVEYGADTENLIEHDEKVVEYPFMDQDYAFAVCRIEPENNVEMLLSAFEQDSPMPLVVVGNWQHNEYSRRLFAKYDGSPNLHLLPAIYDQRELNAVRSRCALYLHGHSCGGTNPSLVEAMYLGLPVIAYDVDFNRMTTENRALYFKDAKGLRELCAGIGTGDCRELGKRMKAIAESRYTWRRISDCYFRLFG